MKALTNILNCPLLFGLPVYILHLKYLNVYFQNFHSENTYADQHSVRDGRLRVE